MNPLGNCTNNTWYADNFLIHGTTPYHLSVKHKRALCIKCSKYHLIDGILFRKKYDNVLLSCFEKNDVEKVLVDLHDGPYGGNFGGETTAHKIL